MPQDRPRECKIAFLMWKERCNETFQVRYLWRKFQFHCFFLACFVMFFTDMLCGMPESLFVIFFLFLFAMWLYIFISLPCWSSSRFPSFASDTFYLLSFPYFLLSFPFTSSLPINPCSSRHIVTHFSLFFKPNLFFNINSSLYPWFYLTGFIDSVFLANRDLLYYYTLYIFAFVLRLLVRCYFP